MAKNYTWMPEDQPDASVWPSPMHEEVTAAGRRLERWVQTVQSEFPAPVPHLIWDRDRLQALEAAVDEVALRDPGPKVEFRFNLPVPQFVIDRTQLSSASRMNVLYPRSAGKALSK